jgi:aspartate kinase
MDVLQKVKIGGILQNHNLAQIGILDFPDELGTLSRLMEFFGKSRINLQFLVHSMDGRGKQSVSFCIERGDLENALGILQHIQSYFNPRRIIHQVPVAILSIFGPHFREKPSIAATMFRALEDAQVPILSVSTSISSLSCVVEEALLSRAVQALQDSFELP